MDLTMGDILYLFKNIDDEDYSDEEKLEAIKRVLKMRDKKLISKIDTMHVINYLVMRADGK